MYGLWRELHPPTAVEACVEARFISPDAVNLIVARTHILQVYNVVECDADTPSPEGAVVKDKVARLELAGEYRLNGNVTSIVAVRTSTSVGLAGMDSLLLSFRDAKEGRPLPEQKEIMTDKSIPEIRMDPQFRCGALCFYGERLAIVPFKQDTAMQTETDEATSFVIPTNAIDVKIKNIVDFAFLYGFVEPTLAILYESTQTWTGRLAGRRDTRALVVISVDTTSKAFPIIYHVQQLPYNSYKIIPVPLPVGGVVVLSTNALIHVDQTSVPGIVCAVNKFYGLEVNLPAPPPAETQGPVTRKDNMLYHNSNVVDLKHLSISLEGAEGVFVNPDTLMLVSRTGEIFLVELVGSDDGSGWRRRKGGVKSFKFTRLGLRAVMPFCISRFGGAGGGTNRTGLSRALGGLGGIGQGFTPGGTAVSYVFLGSRVGNSMLVQIKEHDISTRSTAPPQQDASRRTEMDLDDDDDDDLYGDSSFSRANSSSNLAHPQPGGLGGDGRRFQLRVCDSLLCTGPIRDMAIGASAKYFTDDYAPSISRMDLEIVGCVGEGADGALCVFQRNVRPKILTTVELPQVQDIWAVRCAGGDGQTFHNYLIMSEEYKTTILQTGEELQEVQDTDFYSAGPTVTAASVFGNRFVVQVQPNGVLIINSAGKKVQDIPIGNNDEWIISSSVQDPYIVLLLNDGTLMLLKIDPDSKEITIVHELKGASVSACALFVDEHSKLFTTVGDLQTSPLWRWNSSQALDTSPMLVPVPDSDGMQPSAMNLDDEEDDLYAEKPARPASAGKREPVFGGMGGMNGMNGVNGVGKEAKPSYYCFVYRENGVLEIFSLPSFTQVFCSPYFGHLPAVVNDDFDSAPENVEKKLSVDLNELLAVCLGPEEDSMDPYLMARTALGDLIIYRLFPYLESAIRVADGPASTATPTSAVPVPPVTPVTPTTPRIHRPSPPTRLALRLVRVPHTHLSRELRRYQDTDGDKLNPYDAPSRGTFVKKHHLRAFEGIAGAGAAGAMGYRGVVMTGSRPCWVVAAKEGLQVQGVEALDPLYSEVGANVVGVMPGVRQRGKRAVRVHPCLVDGEMRTFTEFHNVNVPQGFVYVNDKGLLRLCQLPWQFDYDADWPTCRVPLKRTPQKIAYHYESETYVIAASTPVPFRMSKAQHAAAMAAGVIEEGETLDIVRDSSKEDRTGMYYPSISFYNLELVSPVTWETVDRYQFTEYEQVLTLRTVSLHSKQTTSGRKLFLAVGTGWFRGEDLTVRGRLLLFDVIDVVPEEDNPQTNHKFKLLYQNEEKTPVTAVCDVNGYILAAMGSRLQVIDTLPAATCTQIILHSFEDGESLSGVAFIDANIFVNTVTSVKNMILLGDVMKSVMFVGFQEDPPQMRLLGKDYYPLHTGDAEFLIDGNQTSFVVADTDGNVILMNYAPYNIQSEAGQKILRRGELNAGSRVQRILRMRLAGTRDPRTGKVAMPKQYWNVCGTADGGIAFLVPVNEKLYKRAYALYSKMVNSLQHHAGLNPRGFRQIKYRLRPLSTSLTASGPPGPKFVLDGDLLYQYLSLGIDQQRELAAAVGSTVERGVDDLVEAMEGTELF
ncbi:Cleavage and polyadenylation specificity factor subunit 1 [Phlyctochytrium bullatum]|nr:Cleavage and polyadenylation specificity factor subunit 1 [Phlyctochytrium bullatum]